LPPSQAKRIAEGLHCSLAEALSILADDTKIDRGEKLFELSQEQKAVEKKMRTADRKPTVYNFKPRQRVAKPDKSALMQTIGKALADEGIKNWAMVNDEREATFEFNNIKYKIVLSCPRK
jgi:hypothetical protein